MDSLDAPRRSPDEESGRLLRLLVIGTFIVAAIIVWMIAGVFGAPFFVGVFVALFFLCLGALAIAIVWYSMQRH